MNRWLRRLIAVAVLAVSSYTALADVPMPDSARALELSQGVIGSQVRDHAFTDSNGFPRRLSDYRGKPLLVSFVYTGCTQTCPLTVRFLSRAVTQARRVLGPDSFAIATIGFNQPFDTPQAMRALAAQHGVADPKWDFLSPAPGTIEALTREFGFTWYATPKGFDHVTQVTVVDAGGRIYRQIYGDNFDIQMLIEPLKQLITGTPAPAGDWRALLERVRLFCTVYDRASGRYRLDYSLFIGMAIGTLILGAGVASLLREWRSQRGRRA
ncbi:MAG TPA: SCO family protein [Burkholderiales bacterium]|nr:SCO family protein [Burkholderiales bacterium]